MKTNQPKQLKTKCARCQKQIMLLLRFMMPDENTSWYCGNCNSEYKVFSKTEEVEDRNDLIINFYKDKEESIKVWFDDTGKKGTWRIK